MRREDAEVIAEILGGEVVPHDAAVGEEDECVVLFRRPDGRLVVLTGRSVDEYFDSAAYESGHCLATIDID